MSQANFALGFASGMRNRRKELEKEAIAKEERDRRRKREDSTDAYTKEQRDHERSTRPMRERQVKAQTESAEASSKAQQQRMREAAQAAHDEGFYDLVDELDRGIDPGTALDNFNRRGADKIDPRSFKYDHASRRMEFAAPDGTPVKGDVRQMRQVLQDSAIPRSQTGKGQAVRADQAIVNPDGSYRFKGPQYGQAKPTGRSGSGSTKAPAGPKYLKGKAGDKFYDPTTKEWITVPGEVAPPKGGAGGKGAAGGGAKPTKYNLQSAQKEARSVLAQRIGLKYDPATQQVTGGKPGDSQRWLDLSSQTDRLLAQQRERLGSGQAAQMVMDAYSGVLTDEEYLGEVQKKDERRSKWSGKVFGGETDSSSWPFFEEEKLEEYNARTGKTAEGLRNTALTQAEQKLAKLVQAGSVPGYGEAAPPVDESINTQEGTPAASIGKQPVSKGPDLSKLTSKNPDALAFVKAHPRIMDAFSSPAPDGKARVIVLPLPGGKKAAFAMTPSGELREIPGFKPGAKAPAAGGK